MWVALLCNAVLQSVHEPGTTRTEKFRRNTMAPETTITPGVRVKVARRGGIEGIVETLSEDNTDQGAGRTTAGIRFDNGAHGINYLTDCEVVAPALEIGQHVTITSTRVAARYAGVVWTIEFLRALQDGTPVAHLVATEDAKAGKAVMRRLDSVPVYALTLA